MRPNTRNAVLTHGTPGRSVGETVSQLPGRLATQSVPRGRMMTTDDLDPIGSCGVAIEPVRCIG